MKKIKFFAAAMMLCAAGYFGYTAYETATMTDAERMILANIEALTEIETVEDIILNLQTVAQCVV